MVIQDDGCSEDEIVANFLNNSVDLDAYNYNNANEELEHMKVVIMNWHAKKSAKLAEETQCLNEWIFKIQAQMAVNSGAFIPGMEMEVAGGTVLSPGTTINTFSPISSDTIEIDYSDFSDDQAEDGDKTRDDEKSNESESTSGSDYSCYTGCSCTSTATSSITSSNTSTAEEMSPRVVDEVTPSIENNNQDNQDRIHVQEHVWGFDLVNNIPIEVTFHSCPPLDCAADCAAAVATIRGPKTPETPEMKVEEK